ncbi:MAG: sorbosone dehydrogenase family protein, partial [Candidatus Dadabacteria bacterium]|nr:sorbosone dehydrogenase family protein [Candidatus Dadabacteria bacterium]
MMQRIFKSLIPCFLVFLLFGCGCGGKDSTDGHVEAPVEPVSPEIPAEPVVPSEIPTDPMLSRISLPEGFSISLYSNQVPGARSLALGAKGTLFVGTRSRTVYALSDTDGDNYAETVRIIADDLNTPNGVAFREGSLYVAEINRILRYDEIESNLSSPPDPVV